MFVRVILVGVIAAVGISAGSANGISIPLTATDNAFVFKDSPDDDQSESSVVIAKSNGSNGASRLVYLRFDLSSLDGSENVTGASLDLNFANQFTDDSTVYVRSYNNAAAGETTWNGSMTWNTRPDGTGNLPTASVSGQLASLYFSDDQSKYPARSVSFDLDSSIGSLLSGDTNDQLTLLLEGNNSGQTQFSSIDSGNPVPTLKLFTDEASATLDSTDFIVGERQVNGTALGYHTTGTTQIGTGGASNAVSDRNVVLGYTLPTLPAGTTVGDARFFFEIAAARDQSGPDPNLDVYLLDTANPDGSGVDFFYHGPSDPNSDAAFVGRTYAASGSSQVNFPDDSEDRMFALSGDALTLFQSFYGGDHIPDQTEAFFRFNMDYDPPLSDYTRYILDTASDESFLKISTVLIPEPGSLALLAMGSLGLLGFGRRRKR